MKTPNMYFLKKHSAKYPLKVMFWYHVLCIMTALLVLNAQLDTTSKQVFAALVVAFCLSLSEVIAPAVVNMQKLPARLRSKPSQAAVVLVKTAASRITLLWGAILTGLATACYRAITTDSAEILVLGIATAIGMHLFRVLLAYRKANLAERRRKARAALS
ncbi:hypothetical protein [Deinococcus ficus]|uniref:Uncharacterized protein n=1 Tax=Deinococcus ficus TaxID=317577 RepID=A0A221T2Y9_9DEIO|nr:hypothetical protein [Deinococcus ficus]ASN83268.1 hypothetical protein DFI_18900 [Deinococcus ficus]